MLKCKYTEQKREGERGGSVVECRTPEREVGGSKPTAALLCPWARYFTPRKYWLITQEAVAPSRHDWKIVEWDVKPQHKQTNKQTKERRKSEKKSLPVLRFEPPTAYMWIMYDNHHAIEAIINKCRFFVYLDMRVCVN